MNKRWILLEQNNKLAAELASELNIHPLVAQILLNRGISSVEEGKEFLACDLAQVPDPFLMLGMDKAVARIVQALKKEERIVIYGDYDADGQTATALLVRSLRELASSDSLIDYYLPDRLDEGYGLHLEAVTQLAAEFSLLISVDCGISACAEVAHARSLGLDIIITDHHEPGPILPAAIAILNPKQPGCAYPNKELAGVGVALKLVQALQVTNWEKYLDLVTLGTVADLVPLKNENRTWVANGLQVMAQTKNKGIKALLAVADVQSPTAGDVGFRLGPRLNAVGRLGDPTRGVRLLLTEDEKEARMLAVELNDENTQRQDLEAQVLAEAIETVEKYELHKGKALVVWGEGWHQGVVGIVASRLVEKYYLPTIVISVADGIGTASARSIAGLDLYKSLTMCAHLLIRYGGHTMAAGLSLAATDLQAFQAAFEEICAKQLSPDDYMPKIYLDSSAKLTDLTPELIDQLAMLEPHGIGNPGPTLQVQGSITSSRRIGRENQHLQLTIQDTTELNLRAIAFGFGEEQELIEKEAENIFLAFVPRLNEWRGKTSIQLQVKAWRGGTTADSVLQKWLIDYYPWKLPAPYYLSPFLLKETEAVHGGFFSTKDHRGTWNKAEMLASNRSNKSKTLILVTTPVAALEVCRELRIGVPGGRNFITFAHELLTETERRELREFAGAWVVSTGFGLEETSWESVWLWEPPLNEDNYHFWAGLVADGGELVSVFGPQEVRASQLLVQVSCPDRTCLAQIYAQLRVPSGQLEVGEAVEVLGTSGLLPALPRAIQIFSEVGLWKIQEDVIIYQPAPAQKLDLTDTVLYNKVTQMRKQSLNYLKRCLERGFFQDGLKREN